MTTLGAPIIGVRSAKEGNAMHIKKLMFFMGILLCFSVSVVVFSYPPAWERIPIEKNEFFIDTDTGMSLYVAEKKLRRSISDKDRRAVLLIHGSGVGYMFWDLAIEDYSMMEFLSRFGFDVFAVDQRGFGRSSKPSGLEVSGESSADDLKSVIDFIRERTGVDKVDLVGHSWGAVVALYLAVKCPENIGKMVLMGATYKTVHPNFQPVVDYLIWLASVQGVPYIPNQHHLNVEQSLYTYEEDVVDYYKTMIDASYPQIPTGPFLDLDSFDYVDYVPQISHPTLLINGALEYVVDRDDSFEFLSDLDAEKKDLLTIGNAYHLVTLEEVAHERLNRAVVHWLLQ